MTLVFLNSFKKELKKIRSQRLKQRIKTTIIELENASSLTEIKNIKSLAGFSTAYRIRLGDYRLGFFYTDDIIELSRFLKRNDIYKVFPK